MRVLVLISGLGRATPYPAGNELFILRRVRAQLDGLLFDPTLFSLDATSSGDILTTLYISVR